MSPRLRATLLALILLNAASSAQAEQPSAAAPVDFAALQTRESPNDYLLCPVGLCVDGQPDRIAPVFAEPAAALEARVRALLAAQPRIAILSDTPGHLVVEQTSALFGFPDVIDIRIVAVDEARASLAIYSRSRHGYYDFGANERRVSAWLAALQSGA